MVTAEMLDDWRHIKYAGQTQVKATFIAHAHQRVWSRPFGSPGFYEVLSYLGQM